MRIERENDRVVGYVDYNNSGEVEVISLLISEGTVKVGLSMCLPVPHIQAKLVLACYNEAFEFAECILRRHP